MPGFKLYYKAVIIQTVGYWHRNRHMGQWNRIENPEMDPHSMANSSLTKQERIYDAKKRILNKWCWGNWIATCKRTILLHQAQR